MIFKDAKLPGDTIEVEINDEQLIELTMDVCAVYGEDSVVLLNKETAKDLAEHLLSLVLDRDAAKALKDFGFI